MCYDEAALKGNHLVGKLKTGYETTLEKNGKLNLNMKKVSTMDESDVKAILLDVFVCAFVRVLVCHKSLKSLQIVQFLPCCAIYTGCKTTQKANNVSVSLLFMCLLNAQKSCF